MPKKKTGARKKKERQKEIQKRIAQGSVVNAVAQSLAAHPCNDVMECSQADCGRRQRSRFFCYFCGAIQRLPKCGQCGRTKCVSQTGECMVRHKSGTSAVGRDLVGAICDFCEAPVCHSRKCLQTHSCECPFRDSEEAGAMPVRCFECDRNAWDHGGRIFRCHHCDCYLCEDDQFEHMASCTFLDSESYKCLSCARIGQYTCTRCKLAFCDNHLMRAGAKPLGKGEVPNCKKCSYQLKAVSDVSLSTRGYAYGRHGAGSEASTSYAVGEVGYSWGGNSGGASSGGAAGYAAWMSGSAKTASAGVSGVVDEADAPDDVDDDGDDGESGADDDDAGSADGAAGGAGGAGDGGAGEGDA